MMVATPLFGAPQLTGLVMTEAAAMFAGGFNINGADVASHPVLVILLSVILNTYVPSTAVS